MNHSSYLVRRLEYSELLVHLYYIRPQKLDHSVRAWYGIITEEILLPLSQTMARLSTIGRIR
jgi:hypothetical protein